MRELLYLDRMEQAEALLKPQRVEVLRRLAEPHSCTEVGLELGQTPQRVYYHVKRLVQVELVTQVGERRVRGIHEGIYQASAKSFWLSPKVVGQVGERRVQDELSLGYLLNLVEEVQSEVAQLDPATGQLPSLAVSGEIRLRPDRRQEFMDDLRTSLQDLMTKYGGADGDAFRLAVACYPREAPRE